MVAKSALSKVLLLLVASGWFGQNACVASELVGGSDGDATLFSVSLGLAAGTFCCLCGMRCMERCFVKRRWVHRQGRGDLMHWYGGPGRPVSARVLRRVGGLPDFPLNTLVQSVPHVREGAYQECEYCFKELLKKVQKFQKYDDENLYDDDPEPAMGCWRRLCQSLSLRRRNGGDDDMVFSNVSASQGELGLSPAQRCDRGRSDLGGKDEVTLLLNDPESKVANVQMALAIEDDHFDGVLTGLGQVQEEGGTQRYLSFHKKFRIERRPSASSLEDLARFFGEDISIFYRSIFKAGEVSHRRDFSGLDGDEVRLKEKITLLQNAQNVKEAFYIDPKAKTENVLDAFFKRKNQFIIQFPRESTQSQFTVDNFSRGFGWGGVVQRMTVGTTILPAEVLHPRRRAVFGIKTWREHEKSGNKQSVQ